VPTLDETARQFVLRQRVAHLATADADGVPHVVPICFALLDDTLYLALDEKPKRGELMKLRRVRNILANPNVAVVVDVYNDDWSGLGFVLLRGQARVEEAGPEHARAVGALRLRYAQYGSMHLEDRPVIAVDIERVTRWGNLGS
jgi:PPOX class probable F420-dependent enzyme